MENVIPAVLNVKKFAHRLHVKRRVKTVVLSLAGSYGAGGGGGAGSNSNGWKERIRAI